MGDTAPTPTPTPMLDIGPRIGCDVVNVVDVTRSIELFGRRYLDRTFTPHE
ncbi:ACP synthase, partial [Rhodococcus erythropolis]|nr:ACP synthase [Rhodococcus erythropolis]